MNQQEEPKVFHKLNSGQMIETKICNCMECDNEFYVPALSPEWEPSYCPFCGVHFTKPGMCWGCKGKKEVKSTEGGMMVCPVCGGSGKETIDDL